MLYVLIYIYINKYINVICTLFKAQLLAIYFKLKQNDYKFANA